MKNPAFFLEVERFAHLLFGRLAIEEGLIHYKTLLKALKLQQEKSEKKLGEIFLEEGILTSEQIEKILCLQNEFKEPPATWTSFPDTVIKGTIYFSEHYSVPPIESDEIYRAEEKRQEYLSQNQPKSLAEILVEDCKALSASRLRQFQSEIEASSWSCSNCFRVYHFFNYDFSSTICPVCQDQELQYYYPKKPPASAKISFLEIARKSFPDCPEKIQRKDEFVETVSPHRQEKESVVRGSPELLHFYENLTTGGVSDTNETFSFDVSTFTPAKKNLSGKSRRSRRARKKRSSQIRLWLGAGALVLLFGLGSTIYIFWEIMNPPIKPPVSLEKITPPLVTAPTLSKERPIQALIVEVVSSEPEVHFKNKGLARWGKYWITQEQKNILAKNWKPGSRPGDLAYKLTTPQVRYDSGKKTSLEVKGKMELLTLPTGLEVKIMIELRSFFGQDLVQRCLCPLSKNGFFQSQFILDTPLEPGLFRLDFILSSRHQSKFLNYFLALDQEKKDSLSLQLGQHKQIQNYHIGKWQKQKETFQIYKNWLERMTSFEEKKVPFPDEWQQEVKAWLQKKTGEGKREREGLEGRIVSLGKSFVRLHQETKDDLALLTHLTQIEIELYRLQELWEKKGLEIKKRWVEVPKGLYLVDY